LGANGPKDKFVIKSVVGQTQYIVEIPEAAENYDIEIPLADIQQEIDDPLGLKPQGVGQPMITDRELTSRFPNIAKGREDAALVDNAFGVGQGEGPQQSPSYTLAVAKIGKLYQQRKFEYCLIEINNMLSFYPNSPKLYKMKGTVLLKLRNYTLARDAWIKAQELDPSDSKLRKSLVRIDETIQLKEKKVN
jgi:tetratricopeptide (TPR) repeat protein